MLPDTTRRLLSRQLEASAFVASRFLSTRPVGISARPSLVALERSEEGSRGANGLRKTGWIPGIFYGVGITSQNVKAKGLEIASLIRATRYPGIGNTLENQPIELVLGGVTHTVLPRQLQVHPATDRIMNLNFLLFREGLMVDIPVRTINEDQSPGIRRGAFFLQAAWSLRVRALSADIPEFIEVDLSGAVNKEVVRMNRVIIPGTVELPAQDPNFAVGTVVGKRLED
mmetsp:Transcript_33822/g.61852  ORF Transcript_33822/g.61852 Transcript_33822/m.61852 type:complete len:228 (-) Transcript_33822:253-936(-)